MLALFLLEGKQMTEIERTLLVGQCEIKIMLLQLGEAKKGQYRSEIRKLNTAIRNINEYYESQSEDADGIN